MSFFEKMKSRAIQSMAASMGFDLTELAPMAKQGIISMMQSEIQAAGAQIVAVLALNPDGTDLNFATYKVTPEGLVKYKEIDLSDPSKILQLITNGPTGNPAAAEQPAQPQPEPQPGAADGYPGSSPADQ